MLWFSNTNRKRLFTLIKELVSDEGDFERIFADFEKSWRRSFKELNVEAFQSMKRHDINKLLSKVHKLLSEDYQLVHLLLELRRKGVLVFDGVQSENSRKVTAIATDLLEKAKQLEALLTEVQAAVKKRDFFFGTSMPDVQDKLKWYINNLETLVASEKKDVDFIHKAYWGMKGISDGKLFEIHHGDIRIEVHKGYYKLHGARSKRSAGIIIFDHDFIVGDISLYSFTNGEMYCDISSTEIRNRGYVQIAIEQLLLQKKITDWYSDIQISPAAEAMYQRIRKRRKFSVTKHHAKFHVTLG
jgi:hypothetical protein